MGGAFDAREFRQLNVHQHNIGLMFGDDLQGLLRCCAGSHTDAISIRLNELHETFADYFVVLDDGNSGHKTSLGRNLKPHGGAPSGFAGNFKPPAKFFDARPHVVHAVHFFGAGLQRQPTSVVGDGQTQFALSGLDAQADFGGPGVAHNIIERLLESEEQLMTATGSTRCPGCTDWLWKSISSSAVPEVSCSTSFLWAGFAHQTVPSSRMKWLTLGFSELKRVTCRTLVTSNAGWLAVPGSATAICVTNPAPSIKLHPARASRGQGGRIALMASAYSLVSDSAPRNETLLVCGPVLTDLRIAH